MTTAFTFAPLVVFTMLANGNSIQRHEVKMYKHRAWAPLPFDRWQEGEETQDWFVHGASLPMKERILLSPAVPNRHGVFFNKHSLDTQDFSITFDFSVEGDAMLDDQGFGFFYERQNFAENYKQKSPDRQGVSWKHGMILAENTFFGHSSRFRGFGVVFTKAGIHCVEGREMPLSPGDFRRPNFMEFLNRRSSVRIEVSYFGTDVYATIDGVEKSVCNIPGGPLLEAHFGFTSFSGGDDVSRKPPAVFLNNIDTINHDEHHFGEEMESLRDYEFEDILKEDHKYHNEEGQTQAIERLRNVLDSYIKKNDQWSLLNKLSTVQEQLSRLEIRTAQWKNELRTEYNNTEGLSNVQTDLQGLHSILHTTSKAQDASVTLHRAKESHETIHKEFENLFSSREHGESLTRMADSLFFMFVCLCGVLITVVAGIYKTMRNYEKKHFL